MSAESFQVCRDENRFLSFLTLTEIIPSSQPDFFIYLFIFDGLIQNLGKNILWKFWTSYVNQRVPIMAAHTFVWKQTGRELCVFIKRRKKIIILNDFLGEKKELFWLWTTTLLALMLNNVGLFCMQMRMFQFLSVTGSFCLEFAMVMFTFTLESTSHCHRLGILFGLQDSNTTDHEADHQKPVR